MKYKEINIKEHTNLPNLFGRTSTLVRSEKKKYPNEKCPCGSGKKYKKCCG